MRTVQATAVVAGALCPVRHHCQFVPRSCRTPYTFIKVGLDTLQASPAVNPATILTWKKTWLVCGCQQYCLVCPTIEPPPSDRAASNHLPTTATSQTKPLHPDIATRPCGATAQNGTPPNREPFSPRRRPSYRSAPENRPITPRSGRTPQPASSPIGCCVNRGNGRELSRRSLPGRAESPPLPQVRHRCH